jgi:hypothetical protein
VLPCLRKHLDRNQYTLVCQATSYFHSLSRGTGRASRWMPDQGDRLRVSTEDNYRLGVQTIRILSETPSRTQRICHICSHTEGFHSEFSVESSLRYICCWVVLTLEPLISCTLFDMAETIRKHIGSVFYYSINTFDGIRSSMTFCLISDLGSSEWCLEIVRGINEKDDGYNIKSLSQFFEK